MRGLEEGASLPPAQQPRRRHRGIRHRGVRARGGGGRRGGAGRAPGAPRPQRRQPCITAPGLGRRGSGNACVTRRGGLLIMSGRHCHGNFAGSAHSLARSLQPQSPAADRHDHLCRRATANSGAGGVPQPAPPALVPRGRSVGPGARFGYIAVKVHRLERRASRQLYCPMRARSPCRRELASP